MKRRRLGLVGVVPLALIGTSVRGQDAGCERCLTFTPVVELRTVDVPLVPSLSQSVVRIPDGRFLVSHLFSGDPRFAVYDREGEFLQLYGKAGRGPNEFRTAPKLYRGPGGTVWALEPERVVRLDSRLRPLETKRLEATIFGEAAVVLDDGIMVATRRVRSPNGAFFSVSLINSVGGTSREIEGLRDRGVSTAIGAAESGGFWALKANDLLLRRYSGEGELVETLPITIDSFQPWEPEAAHGGGGPPPPGHYALVQLGGDLLLVLTAVPESDWAPLPNRGFRLSEINPNETYDTSLALLDVGTGRLIGMKRVPEYLHVVGGASRLAFTVNPDRLGNVRTTVFRIEARRP